MSKLHISIIDEKTDAILSSYLVDCTVEGLDDLEDQCEKILKRLKNAHKNEKYLTQWFWEQKPALIGVYQVRPLFFVPFPIRYSYWDGNKFHGICGTKEDALDETFLTVFDLEWRGINCNKILGDI